MSQAELPSGWTLSHTDREVFSLPGAKVVTWAAAAAGGAGEAALAVVASDDESDAVRAVGECISGRLMQTDGWALPVPRLASHGVADTRFVLYGDRDAAVEDALADVDGSLPAGWTLYDSDREKYRLVSATVAVWVVSAVGPGGAAAMAMAIGEAAALRQLGRTLRGELHVTRRWAPILDVGAGTLRS